MAQKVIGWINFNGTAGTIANSYNISSITVNGTGTYTVNFSFSDSNYAAILSTEATSVIVAQGNLFVPAGQYDSSGVKINIVDFGTRNDKDSARVCMVFYEGH